MLKKILIGHGIQMVKWYAGQVISYCSAALTLYLRMGIVTRLFQRLRKYGQRPRSNTKSECICWGGVTSIRSVGVTLYKHYRLSVISRVQKRKGIPRIILGMKVTHILSSGLVMLQLIPIILKRLLITTEIVFKFSRSSNFLFVLSKLKRLMD